MKILILNWRDIENPSSGGAEILTHEIAKRWVKKGHRVTIFSSYFSGAKKEAVIDGILIKRKGRADARFLFGSVHFLAIAEYFRSFKGKFDIVIDEIHGLPFFTPLYIQEKKIALICEVADDLWYKMFGPIFGLLGRLMEIIYLRTIYTSIQYLTISNSTKDALMQNGVKEGRISVMPMGITVPSDVKSYRKEDNPTLLFVARLAKPKGIEDLLYALKELKNKYPSITLWIVGRGKKSYVNKVEELVGDLGLSKNIKYYGFIEDKKKFELMSKAHLLVSPSVKEGFGLTIPEAGYMGTPAVVYNSYGLSELVIHNKTGLICKKNTPENLAMEISKLLEDKSLYQDLAEGAKLESRKYNWDRTADFVLNILKNTIS